jgi:hypothetical protein
MRRISLISSCYNKIAFVATLMSLWVHGSVECLEVK